MEHKIEQHIPKPTYFSLFQCIIANNFENFSSLLSKINDVSYLDMNNESQCSLLNRAVQSGRTNFVHLLLTKGADVNQHQIVPTNLPLHETSFLKQASTLHSACKFLPKLELIQALINAGADVNFRDFDNKTPLFYLDVQNEDQKNIIQLLLKAGSSIYGQGRNQPLLNEIQEALGKNYVFVPMGKDLTNDYCYRLATKDGQPYLTLKELINDHFKKNISINYLVSHSLFKNVQDSPLCGVVKDLNFATWLSKEEIKTSSEVSAVRDEDGMVLNSALLIEAYKESIDKSNEDFLSL